jgi:hypothetical protein
MKPERCEDFALHISRLKKFFESEASLEDVVLVVPSSLFFNSSFVSDFLRKHWSRRLL